MPMNLSTVLSHVETIPNESNKILVRDFYEYFKQKQKLKIKILDNTTRTHLVTRIVS